jgi:predicted Rossmann-fold nucleotide-binding protein
MTIVLNPSSQLINISSFPGVSFLDTWVHVKKMIDFDPSCPTVLVVGSVLEFVGSSRKLLARDQLLDLCKGLATSLTAFDFNIVNGACPGLPDDVMREFQAIRSRGITIGLSAYPDPHNHTLEKTFAPGGFPITADVTVFCGTGFELLNVLNTLCIDLVVTIGGGVGTLLEIASAVEQELPVLCLGTSGGISQEAEELLRRYLAAFKHFELRTVPTLHELHTQLEAFASKFRLESRTTRMAPLLAEIAANPGQKPHSIKISFNTDEDVIHYGYSGETVALHNPRVVTDRIRLARIPIRGDIILHSLEEVARDYVIDGISLRLSARQQQRIWGPSIDTLIILQVL